jgi:hypothetical protein
LSMVPESKIPGKDRIVARSRQWSTATTSYGNWRLYVADPNRTQPIVFRLNLRKTPPSGMCLRIST